MSNKQPPGCLAPLLKLLGIELKPSAPEGLPYTGYPSLLTPAEFSFYRVLQQCVGQDFVIFAKVRMADVLSIPKRTEKRQSFLNRISSKHVDFVLCNPTTLEVSAAIELDDKSHSRASRKERDRFVDEAFAVAGIPLIHIRAAKSYSLQEVGTAVQCAFSS